MGIKTCGRDSGVPNKSLNICNDYAGRAILLPLDRRQMTAVLQSMLNAARKCGKILGGIDLRLVCDAEIARINRRHLFCEGPTNIISFPAKAPEHGLLILSLDTYARELVLYGQEEVEHFIRLLAHGCGHLAGLDHSAEMDIFCGNCYENALTAYQKDFSL